MDKPASSLIILAIDGFLDIMQSPQLSQLDFLNANSFDFFVLITAAWRQVNLVWAPFSLGDTADLRFLQNCVDDGLQSGSLHASGKTFSFQT